MTNATVTKEAVMSLLTRSCPGFASRWKQHLEWWEDESPGVYNHLSTFALYLKDQLRTGNTDEFSEAFAAIERMMVRGNPEVREALTVGLFEDLHDDSETAAQFLQFAGPYSRAGWYWVMGSRFNQDGFEEVLAREIELRNTAE